VADINNKNQNNPNVMSDCKDRARAGFLYGVAKVFAVFVPTVYAFSLACYIGVFIGAIEPEKDLPTIGVVVITVCMTLVTGFLAVCACTVRRILILRFARIIAISFVFSFVGYTIVGFICETVFGRYLEGWFVEGGLVFIPISIFYYQMVKFRIKFVKRESQVARTVEAQEPPVHN